MIFNPFRITADIVHLLSFLILIYRLWTTQSARSVSLKTQYIYLIVFCTRYLDLLWNFKYLYNYIFKIVFISCTVIIIYLVRNKFKHSYNEDQDMVNILTLIIPSIVLAFIFHPSRHPSGFFYSLFNIIWTFSLYLESVAIVPQLVLLAKSRIVESSIANFVFFLGLYRTLYIFNWIYRFFTESNYRGVYHVWIAGFVQSVLYLDFFYQYLKAKVARQTMILPG
ncbi:hypothetical protein P9112_012955 [Eukaryota sp. TZLM1-RC]